MSQLCPCPSCRRHVRLGAAECPFCGAPAPVPVVRSPRVVSSLSRAALFAGATLAHSGCGASQNPATPPVRSAAGDAAPEPAALADAGPPAAQPVPDETGVPEGFERGGGGCFTNSDGVVSCPPYGAPPSLDDFLV